MEYFAKLGVEELGPKLISKIELYDSYLETSGLLQELRESYSMYYGEQAISKNSKGSLDIHVNDYYSLINSIVALVTTNRPAFEARASNSDHKTQAQCLLANSILDYYVREKRLEREFKHALEIGLFLKESWFLIPWQTDSGEVVRADNGYGKPEYEGDISTEIFTLNNLIRDFSVKKVKNCKWFITREIKNKWDVVAKYQEHTDRILSLSDEILRTELNQIDSNFNSSNEDNILFYTFWHERTPYIPSGRYTEFLSDGTVLFDGALPYDKIPLFRVSSSEQVDTTIGHSFSKNLMPLQTALNKVWGALVTNNVAFGVQHITAENGSGVTSEEISDGLNLIGFPKGSAPPAPLQLLRSSPESYNFIQAISSKMEVLSNQNQVSRGNAPASLSGAAMALLASQAIQQNSGIQSSYVSLLEDAGTAIINHLKQFAKGSKRVAYIVGKSQRAFLKEFSGDDLIQISRVTVDSANALTKTVAGRTQLADTFIQHGLIKNASKYLEVVETGNLTPLLESENSKYLNIRDENEKLSEGVECIVMITDDHPIHVAEHLSLLDSTDTRNQPQIVSVVLNHVQEHIEKAKTQDPLLMQLLGRQPLRQMQAPLPQQGNAPSVADTMQENQIEQNASEVKGPSMPTNPLTKEKFEPGK